MDTQSIINTLFGIVVAASAWFVNIMWAMVQSLQMQVSELNIELAKNYVTRAEVQRSFDNFDKKLDEIYKILRETKA